MLDVARGGEAQRVTAAPTAASVPQWSPDGTEILFQAAMWPGATDEESNRKAVQERKNAKSKVRIYDTFPIKNFDHWIEESKSHLWVVDVAGDRKARSLFGGSKAAAAAGFGGDALAAVWSPDGQRRLRRDRERHHRGAGPTYRRTSGRWPRAAGSRSG